MEIQPLILGTFVFLGVTLLMNYALHGSFLSRKINGKIVPVKKRELVVQALLFAGIMLCINYIGYGWIAPQKNKKETVVMQAHKEIMHKPLALEVDFTDKQTSYKQEEVVIKTPYARMTFSNDGGICKNMTFIRNTEHKEQEFMMWDASFAVDREQMPFLIALDKKTPYAYKMVDYIDAEDEARITYQADTDEATITKKFHIAKKAHIVTLDLSVDPHMPTSVRVVWPSFYSVALGDANETAAALYTDKNTFKTFTKEALNFDQSFVKPSVFGSMNKYFAFVMYQDTHAFAQRAYYKLVDKTLLSFLASDTITTKKEWKISWYCGPKELHAIATVDTRLEKLLNYGFFSFISKPLTRMLSFFKMYTGNYGWAIVFVTLFIKLLLLPFTWRGDKNMRKFQENQKKLEYIQKKYKDDPQALEAARLEHIKKHGMGGLVGGCLPNLVQMLIFPGLYGALSNSLELYKAPFVGWIQDLSMPDPYYVLPVLILIGFLFSLVIAPGKKDIKTLIPAFAMALVFGTFIPSMASGLTLYICINIWFQSLQSFAQKTL